MQVGIPRDSDPRSRRWVELLRSSTGIGIDVMVLTGCEESGTLHGEDGEVVVLFGVLDQVLRRME